mmetsp:Transcript_31170/g.47691  ORF Transcript_31170/g.47691 Transcript_31170/m.47691 type:complete len:137 (-) Transcript_31170:399-809(-)
MDILDLISDGNLSKKDLLRTRTPSPHLKSIGTPRTSLLENISRKSIKEKRLPPKSPKKILKKKSPSKVLSSKSKTKKKPSIDEALLSQEQHLYFNKCLVLEQELLTLRGLQQETVAELKLHICSLEKKNLDSETLL